jgi:hypothetical protein
MHGAAGWEALAITHENNQMVVTVTVTMNKKRSHSMKMSRTIPVLLASFCTAALWAQQPTPPPPAHKMEMSGKPGMMDEKKMDESMMAHHKEMMAKMDAMDARLDDLVKKMDAAKGSKKADAVAAVVNELVAQRKQMREHMMTMLPEMMKHMMEHMQMGMMKGMMECPMMKGMESKSGPGKSDEHSEHHPN